MQITHSSGQLLFLIINYLRPKKVVNDELDAAAEIALL
jgi:hypothetical protein